MKEIELTSRDKTVIVDRKSLLQSEQRHPYLVPPSGMVETPRLYSESN